MKRNALLVVLFTTLLFSATMSEIVPEAVHADAVAPVATSTGFWWEKWPRSSTASDLQKISDLKTSVVLAYGPFSDEGRGSYFRENYIRDDAARLQALKQSGVKVLSWIEGQGQARAFIGAIEKKSDGTFTLDPRSGAAQIISHNWTWDYTGPDLNPRANTIVWFSTHAFANNESWQGPYILANSGLATPTYPNGTPAVGYTTGGNDPRTARLYDAMGGKNINGDVAIDPAQSGEKAKGKISVNINGRATPIGDFSFSKDMASPWWLKYNLWTAQSMIEHGADGFWVDNYSGWDFISATPVNVAFGEWSVSTFRTFLKNSYIGRSADFSQFDIRQYIKDKIRGWTHASADDLKNLGHAGYRDERWLQDPIWKAYLVHKSQIAARNARDLYTGIKAAAQKLGRQDQVYVGGNDSPSISFAALKGQEMDQVNTEYTPGWSLHTGATGIGLPPDGHFGPFCAAALRFGRSHSATIWYYLDSPFEKYRGRKTLGEVGAYEALANNCMIHSDVESGRHLGTKDSVRTVNTTIEKAASIFRIRTRIARVGVVLSSHTQYSFLTPGGFFGFDATQSTPGRPAYLDHNLGYFGWGGALEDLKIPYKSIPDFRLNAKELESVSVLILPHVRSIDPELVNTVLIPFVKRGGALIITGRDAGALNTTDAFFAPLKSPSLADLRNLKAKGAVIFTEENPGFEFHMGRLPEARSRRTRALQTIAGYFKALQGVYAPEILFQDWGPRVRTAVYESEGRMFFDLVNTDLDLERDTLTASRGGRVTLKVLPQLRGKKLKVSFFDGDHNTLQALSVIGNGTDAVGVTVPPFRVYGSVLVEGE